MYQSPDIKIVVLATQDIVTTSDGVVVDGSWGFGQ